MGGILSDLWQAGHRNLGFDKNDFSCGCATENFAVAATGAVYPCISVPWTAGNIHETSLSDIWKTSPVFNEIRGLKPDHFETCYSCPVKKTCFRHASSVFRLKLRLIQATIPLNVVKQEVSIKF